MHIRIAHVGFGDQPFPSSRVRARCSTFELEERSHSLHDLMRGNTWYLRSDQVHYTWSQSGIHVLRPTWLVVGRF